MTIIFNNPHGAPVRINKEHAVVVDTNEDGITYAATDPDTGTTMIKLEPLISDTDFDDSMKRWDYQTRLRNFSLGKTLDCKAQFLDRTHSWEKSEEFSKAPSRETYTDSAREQSYSKSTRRHQLETLRFCYN
jgi:hypothetical protein